MSVARRAGARIVVTGAARSSTAARSFLRAELDGVRFADAGGAEPDEVNEALGDADMLVFVAAAGDTADEPGIAALAEAARARGVLVAALVVGRERHGGGSALLGALREAADMVMIVRDADDVHAVVSALR